MTDKPKRHDWSSKSRPDIHNTIQRCWDCGMLKIGRHENGQHWTEYNLGHEVVSRDKTPVCEPVEVPA